jgi:hypothetical protein
VIGVLAVGGVLAGVLASRGRPASASHSARTVVPGGGGASVPGPAGSAPAGTSTPVAPASVPQAPPEPPRPSVAIDIDGLPQGAVLYVDNETVLTTHLTFPQGSTHGVRVTAPGRLPYESQVAFDTARTLTVSLALDPALIPDVPAAAPPPPQPPVEAEHHAGPGHRPYPGTLPPRSPSLTVPGRRPGNPLLPLNSTY